MRAMNRNVLGPWSEVEIRPFGGPSVTNAVGLAVPKHVIPNDAGPGYWEIKMGTERLIAIDELPGLADGLAFLRRRFPDVAAEWDKIRGLLGEYESTRLHRRDLLVQIVAKSMTEAFPNLTALTRWEMKRGSYFIESIVMAAEENGYYMVEAQDQPIQVTKTQQQVGQEILNNLDDGRYRRPLVFGVSDQDADPGKMEAVLSACVGDSAVKHDNERMRRVRAALDERVPAISRMLKDAVVRVELDAS